MRMHMNSKLALTAVILASVGCGDQSSNPVVSSNDHTEQAELEGNRVAIPSSVRSNLGIGFVKVERRNVERTLRVPGRFEYLPNARREYRTMLPGRVELFVSQFDRVDEGDLLYTIDSPAWREIQRDLAETVSSIQQASTKLATLGPLEAAHEAHRESLEESIRVWEQRIEQLEGALQAGGGVQSEYAEARVALTAGKAAVSEVLEKHAEIDANRAETQAVLDAKQLGLELLLESASMLTGLDRFELVSEVEREGRAVPRWQMVRRIEVRAADSGVVEAVGITSGAWADQTSAVLTVIQPERLRFHAGGMQSDLGALRDGLSARIVPPTASATGRGVPITETMSGTLQVGLSGDARDRTIELYVVPDGLLSWARAGVTGQLEILTDPSAGAELAIPAAAVQRDGLTPVVFRRDPGNPDQAMRLEADLGATDGRWIEILSGVREGDEIVLDGAFQLMLATSGSAQKGGHFHADGTFHEGGH